MPKPKLRGKVKKSGSSSSSSASPVAVAAGSRFASKWNWAIIYITATIIVAILLSSMLRSETRAPVEKDGSNNSDRTVDVDGREIIIVKDFLPVALAEKWRLAMRAKWNHSRPQSNISPPEDAEWVYTSNTNGKEFNPANLNQKVRGNKNIDARRKQAREVGKTGMFAYSKWELSPDNELVKEIKNYMLSEEPKLKVARRMGIPVNRITNELSDLFVTLYAEDDFLSPHDDSFAGQYAFVLSLMDGPDWNESFGGELKYFCQTKRKWCQTLTPSFNSAVLFRTMEPKGPFHQVMPITKSATAAGWYRFGFTGWYMDTEINLSAEGRRERDQMRGTTA